MDEPLTEDQMIGEALAMVMGNSRDMIIYYEFGLSVCIQGLLLEEGRKTS